MPNIEPTMNETLRDTFTSKQIDHLKFFRHIRTDLNREEFSGEPSQIPAINTAEAILKESRPIDTEKVIEIRKNVTQRLLSDSQRKAKHPYTADGLSVDFSSVTVSSGIRTENFQIDVESLSRSTNNNSDVEQELIIRYNEIITDETEGQVAYAAKIDQNGRLQLEGYAQMERGGGAKTLRFDSIKPNYLNDIEPQTALEILTHISQEYLKKSAIK